MSDELAWVDAPDCSTGHKMRPMDKHEWRPAPDGPPPKKQGPGGVEYQSAWCPYRTCAFCGSIHPQDLLRVLEDETSVCLTMAEYDAALRAGPPTELLDRLPAITLEWADMKYGHPHKLYVKHNDRSGRWGKFYVSHLVELPTETLMVVGAALGAKTRVLFTRDEVGVKWKRLVVPSGPAS